MGLTRASVFPSRYLGKEDLTRPTRYTISDVRLETIKSDHGDEDKPVLAFSEAGSKPMICNSGNWDTIASSYGEDSDGWRGKPIEVYVDPGVTYGGRRVGGVRVRVVAGAPAAAPQSAADLLTWEQAKAAANAAGITYEDLVASLKANGRPGWNPARDTALAREIIAARAQAPAEQSFDADVPPPDDGVPF